METYEMSFKRSPSKVWWGNDSLEYRDVSASPGSQDSGFSDTETSPHNLEKDRNGNNNNQNVNKKTNSRVKEGTNDETPKNSNNKDIAKNIFKNHPSLDRNKNLTSNYKEKLTPVKNCIDGRLIRSEVKTSPIIVKKIPKGGETEPVRKQRFVKYSPKVSRNLFISKNTKECLETNANQYSILTPSNKSRSPVNDQTDEEENSRSVETPDYDTSSEISGTKSAPLLRSSLRSSRGSRKANKTAPAVLETSVNADEYEAVTSFNTSECESELEELFSTVEGPEYTSTPKGDFVEPLDRMRHRRGQRGRLQPRLKLRYPDNERVPPIHTDGVTIDNKAVLWWLEEAKLSIEQECMTMLQCKSIAAELSQKVNHFAACTTTMLRGFLSHVRCIEMDYKNLNCESSQVNPLVQSLAGNILDFFKTHAIQVTSKVIKLHDQIKNTPTNGLGPLELLYVEWEAFKTQALIIEIKKLVEKLEDPTSELDLRASLTGITSVALRNTDLIENFVKADIIPVLLILCEKCDGSSMRTLILRALSTMCSNSTAIRQFEKFSGVQIIADTLEEESRPEPERSEAVALLAQVTAPWLEDNHSVKGLQDYSKKLVSSLTKFSANTKCCQNLLLCAAALANLSSMDNKCIKFLIQYKSAPVLLAAVKNRGPMVSVYLLEQVATLIANMAALEDARSQLTNAEGVPALLHFLKPPRLTHNEDVERRLQQKSVIALSRLCGDKNGSQQVVDNDGLKRLVQLCREKQERFNSDAVLVATLATLRKIAEACGTEMLSVQDCQELVEPKLLDSFLAYSAQNESYV